MKIELSRISALHYYKLFVRSAMFLIAACLYIFGWIENEDLLFGSLERFPVLVALITLCYAGEMALRFLPSSMESMGCQKQFEVNFKPAKRCKLSRREMIRRGNKGIFGVFFAWVGLNSIFFVLYGLDIIDSGILLLLSLAYGVCDMICILFFCPFQMWFMKNKCCGSCRIYNWDYAMMFTPLLCVNNIFAHILILLSLLLFVRWELNFYRHPERFFEESNVNLLCENCKEKLCSHKISLQKFLVEFWKARKKG